MTGYMSGDGFAHLREGWALSFGSGTRRGHWWTEITGDLPPEFPRIGKRGAQRYYRARCSSRLFAITNGQVPMFRVGNCELCKRCQRVAPRLPNADDRANLGVGGWR